MRTPGSIRAFREPTPPAPPVTYRCGVPACEDGRVVSTDERDTVVECDTHEARTIHDTTPVERGEQNVIRVQDAWRQHGVTPTKK